MICDIENTDPTPFMAREKDARYQNPDDDPGGPYVLVDITSPVFRPALTFEWRGHSPPPGRSWRFTPERLEELEAQGVISFPSVGRPRLKRYLSDVTPKDVTDESPVSRVEVIVREAMQGLAMEIAKNPTCLNKIEWRDLERILREVFEGLGFSTELTRSSKDGGFDLRLTCDENSVCLTYLVEVKHWVMHSKKPGLPAVSALFDIVVSAPTPTIGLLLSSSGFTQEVLRGRSEVEQQRVHVGGQEKIVSLCQSYVQSGTGLWKPAIGLPEMLLQGTFGIDCD